MSPSPFAAGRFRLVVARIGGYEIRAVRGRVDESLGGRLVEFWTGHGALDEPSARERLGSVVCVLADRDGEIAGVNPRSRAASR